MFNVIFAKTNYKKMKTRAYLFISIIFILLISACSKYNVVHVQKTGEVSKKNGIYYNLPKTIVTIDVTITKTEKIKGPYAQYAQKYLGISNVNTANTTSYEISDIALDTYSEPDSSQYYCIE